MTYKMTLITAVSVLGICAANAHAQQYQQYQDPRISPYYGAGVLRAPSAGQTYSAQQQQYQAQPVGQANSYQQYNQQYQTQQYQAQPGIHVPAGVAPVNPQQAQQEAAQLAAQRQAAQQAAQQQAIQQQAAQQQYMQQQATQNAAMAPAAGGTMQQQQQAPNMMAPSSGGMAPAQAMQNPDAASTYAGAGVKVQQSSFDSSVHFVTGGIGEPGRSSLKAMENNYRLKLMFAAKTGHYLSDVEVTITDKNGQTIISTVTDGPFLLTDLKPGTYHVRANYDGQTQDKKVTVGSSGLKTQNFYFATSEV